ncbi:hypothetical protein MCAP1_001647 [Malassezia caprae]|uniref:Armadillo repeat-containing protein 8 n=1 Tax=Malassezia caprae TaxID=1381934 RepID=A0AAF0IW04_9BASI|nr:hypothetical protein MCAP1_001647 [Malassezia caprae]
MLRHCGAEALALPELLHGIVGRRRAKSRVVQEGIVPLVAATLLRGGPDSTGPAAHVLGSLAQHATPPTLLALLRARVPCVLLYALHKVRCGCEEQRSIVAALVRALRTVLVAVASQVGASVRWGTGSGWGTAAMTGLGAVTCTQPLPLPLRRSIDWRMAGPSAADAQAALTMFGPDEVVTSSPQDELFERCREAIDTLFDHLDDLLWALCEPPYGDAIRESVASILSVCLPVAGRAASNAPHTAAEERDARVDAILRYRSPSGTLAAAALVPMELSIAPDALLEVALWALEEMLACAPSRMRAVCTQPLPSLLTVLDAVMCLAVHRTSAVRLAAYASLLRLPPTLCPPAYLPDALVERLLDVAEEGGLQGVTASFVLARVLQAVPALAQHLDARVDGGERLVACVENALSQLQASSLCAAGWQDDVLVRRCEGALYALAACCAGCHLAVERVVEQHACLVPEVLRPALVSAPAGVQAGTARLVRSLSRNVRLLRTVLHDAAIADALVLLLQSPYEIVQLEALCALGNMAVKQSPSRTSVLQAACLAHLAELSRTTRPPVQTQALCVLKNALGGATAPESQAIITALGPAFVCTLLVSPEAAVQEQGMSLVRNLAAVGAPDVPAAEAMDLLATLGHDAVLDAVECALRAPASVPVLEQAAFALANVAAGSPALRAALASRPALLHALCTLLQHPHTAAREAGVLWP